uniref:Cyclin-dependent kinase 2 homolog n=1 Tax=Globisporangium ultimum (strain ATCC 200006 / CBS 805.95 / DAOM BR144) TaxID=431595 RepID=K3WPD7_GLOUD
MTKAPISWTARDAERHFEPLGTCRDVDEFEKLNRIGEGTYGTVYRARDRQSKRIVALKRVILHNEASEGFPITALREIKLLKRLRHPNCVQLLDVAVGRKRSSVFLVFEYCEHDLSLLIRHHLGMRNPFKESEIKRILLSILHAIHYLHKQSLLHRDIKLSNILYDRYGAVKLADFGLARETSRLAEDSAEAMLTPKVVTLWYRAPEILFGCDTYTTAVDMWACGCIFGELLLQEPLMPGKTELDQVERIFKLLGRANDHIWSGMSSLPNADAFHFDASQYSYNNIRKVLPDLSDKAEDAIAHPYFREKPFPQESSMMPTFPSFHPDMKDKPTHESRVHSRESVKFGDAFGAPPSAAAAVKKRRL